MTPQQLYNIVINAHKFHKNTVIKDKDKEYTIFSTPDEKGNIKKSNWCKTEQKTIQSIGEFNGFTKEHFIKLATGDNWQFIRYMDIDEIYNLSGYTKGMKVAIHPDSKKMCEEKEIGWSDEKSQMIKDGFGYFARFYGSDFLIYDKNKSDYGYFPPEAISPYIETEAEDEAEKLIKRLEELGKIKDGKIII